MLYKIYQLAFCSLLQLQSMITMNQVRFYFEFCIKKISKGHIYLILEYILYAFFAERKCTVFYSAPNRSKMISKLCSEDVCQCAESKAVKIINLFISILILASNNHKNCVVDKKKQKKLLLKYFSRAVPCQCASASSSCVSSWMSCNSTPTAACLHVWDK